MPSGYPKKHNQELYGMTVEAILVEPEILHDEPHVEPVVVIETTTQEAPIPTQTTPQAIQLLAPDCFYDDDGALHDYKEGLILRSQQNIELMLIRQTKMRIIDD